MTVQDSFMILGVYQYRCKCGVRLQVSTETDKSRIDEGILLEVPCPNCQKKQIISAHRITKIDVDLPAEIRTRSVSPQS